MRLLGGASYEIIKVNKALHRFNQKSTFFYLKSL